MNNVRDRAGRSICNWMHLFIYYNTYVHLDTYNHIAGEGVLNLQKLWCAFTAVTFSFFSISELQLFHCTYRHHYFTLHREHQIAKKKKILTFFAFVSPPRLSLCVLSVEHRYGGIVYILLGPYRSTFLFISFSACNIWYTESGFYSQCVQFLSPSWAYPPIHSISFSLSMQHSRLTHTQTFLTNSKFCFDI